MTTQYDYERHPLREALLRGFMKTSTSEGEHHITLSFETLEDMQEARKALYHAIRERRTTPETEPSSRYVGPRMYQQEKYGK